MEGENYHIELLNEEEIKAQDDTENIMQYLPDSKPSVLTQVEKDYDHMIEVRRQVREKKL